MRAIMLLAKAAWFYDPVSDQVMRRENFREAMAELSVARHYGPVSAATASFIEKITEPEKETA